MPVQPPKLEEKENGKENGVVRVYCIISKNNTNINELNTWVMQGRVRLARKQ